MSHTPKLIVLEFNELCPALLQRYMELGQLPAFRRLYQTSTVCTTDADEEQPNLDPWIQWPTVHSGMTFADHGVFHLGEGARLDKKCVAELLANAGVRVGVFGSMNLNYHRLNGYLIPDAWDPQGRTQPAALQPFFDFVSRQVQESSTAKPLSKKDALKFAACLVRFGLSSRTAAALVKQLVAERSRPALRWRRPSLLDRIQYDLFRSLNRRFHVDFATLFCNSTAHYQHYYWRNMQPELFEVPPPLTDDASLATAILYGYQQMDKIVDRTLHDYPRSTIMLCTAMSQQPWTDTTKCTYRPTDFTEFLRFAGIAPDRVDVKPVMAEEFHLLASDDATARDAERRLSALCVASQPLMHVERKEASLFCGCRITDVPAPDAQVVAGSGDRRPFNRLMHLVHSMRSGRHHPDGVWWIRTGKHQVIEGRVPLVNVAPTILAHFHLPRPSYMTGDPLGASAQPAQTVGV